MVVVDLRPVNVEEMGRFVGCTYIDTTTGREMNLSFGGLSNASMWFSRRPILYREPLWLKRDFSRKDVDG